MLLDTSVLRPSCPKAGHGLRGSQLLNCPPLPTEKKAGESTINKKKVTSETCTDICMLEHAAVLSNEEDVPAAQPSTAYRERSAPARPQTM